MAESLPEAILTDILLRVPAESLERFKFVCKRLKAGDLIPRQRIFIGGNETIDYKALDASEGRVVVPHKIKTIKSGSNWQIVGSGDGLVCFLVSGNFSHI